MILVFVMTSFVPKLEVKISACWVFSIAVKRGLCRWYNVYVSSQYGMPPPRRRNATITHEQLTHAMFNLAQEGSHATAAATHADGQTDSSTHSYHSPYHTKLCSVPWYSCSMNNPSIVLCEEGITILTLKRVLA